MPLDMTDARTAPGGAFREITIAREMTESYGAYAMSVIVGRALPDVRDGLKPVHRRIVYAMKTGGYSASDRHKKSARVVGDVMGKYHPHGDSAIYEAMARMAQPFKMGEPMVDGQGNFGSVDGDPPAAMRYTEARLSALADQGLAQDLDEDAVDFQPNYDGSESEPRVLPARFPNILVNGGEGIAVGMATSIPPHNLGEVIDLTLAFMADPGMSLERAMEIVPGPDFPTGGVIRGRSAVRQAYAGGRGRIPLSGVVRTERGRGGRESLVVVEIPYGVNKKDLVAAIGTLVNEKSVEGVSDVRDESDESVRIVVDVKRDADAQVVLAQLLRRADLRVNIGVNMTCLSSRREPRVMGLLEIVSEFVAFRRDAVRRRTAFRMEERRNALERQLSLYAARSRVDDVVRAIRAAADRPAAEAALMGMDFPISGEFAALLAEVDPDAAVPEVYRLDRAGAELILRMQLSSLTAMQQDRIAEEARSILADIGHLLPLLEDPSALDALIRAEMEEIKARHARPRRTVVEEAEDEDIDDDELVEDRLVVLTLTRGGYVKRTMLDAYREQARGGKGKSGMDTKETDVVVATLVCSTRARLLFFTDRGIAHALKAWRLPDAPPNARGRHVSNILKMAPGEGVAAVMPSPVAGSGRSMLFVTDVGDVRRNSADDFADIRGPGKIAMKMEGTGARLIAVLDAGDGDDVVLATRRGKGVRFPIGDLRVFAGRSSTGVKGISMAGGDEVVSACTLRGSDSTAGERRAYLASDDVAEGDEGDVGAEGSEEGGGEVSLSDERRAAMAAGEQNLLTVTAQGHGKVFSSYDMRLTARGAQGVWLGPYVRGGATLVALVPVAPGDGIVMVSGKGQTIRVSESEVRRTSRAARGVRMFDLGEGETIVDVARVPSEG